MTYLYSRTIKAYHIIKMYFMIRRRKLQFNPGTVVVVIVW